MNDANHEHTDMLDSSQLHQGVMHCTTTADGHCVTCSDEAVEVTVLSVDQKCGVALASVQETTEEIDITLIDTVAPGDHVLVHGGVAIAHLDEAEVNHE